MLVLGKSLLKSLRFVQHYSGVIWEAPLLLIRSLTCECVVSWIWDSSSSTWVVVLSEALWNVLACNRANWRSVKLIFTNSTDELGPSYRWSMVHLKSVILLEVRNLSGIHWVNSCLVVNLLCRYWEMVHTCSISFDRIVLLETCVGWLHQPLRWNLSVIDIASCLHLSPHLRHVVAVLVRLD